MNHNSGLSFGSYSATKDQVLALRDLCENWHQELSYCSPDQLFSWLEKGSLAIYFLEESRRYWHAVALFQICAPDADLIYIYIRPGSRNQGLAKTLLSNCFGLLKQTGISKVFLEVRQDNFAAKKLYERLFMTLFGTRKRYYSDGTDADLYCVDLPHAAE